MVAYLAGREKELAAAAGFTVEKCLKKYLHQHDLASAAGQHSAAVQAITGAARLFGFDKVVKVLEDKITPLSDKDRENFENAARDMNVKLAAG